MNRSEIDAIAVRLENLERANAALLRTARRWKRAGAGALLGALLVIGAGAKYVDELQTVEAGHFVLRDQSGRMRAALGIRPDGTPGLGLFDDQEHVRLSFDIGPDGSPGVNVYDQKQTLRAALAMRPDGTPGLGLFDDQKKVRLSLDLGNDGIPGLNVYDKQSILRAALAMRPDGTPGFGLFDNQGRITFSLDGEVGVQEPEMAGSATPSPGPLH